MARPDFDTRPRHGHNFNYGGGVKYLSKVTFMANAKGYVMVRRPGCMPFVITEKQWLEFPLWSEFERRAQSEDASRKRGE